MQVPDDNTPFREFRQRDLLVRLLTWFTAITAIATSFLGFLWTGRTGLRTFFREPVPVGGDGIGTAFWLRIFSETPGLHLLQPLSTSKLGWPGEFKSAYFPGGNWVEYSLIRIYVSLSNTTDPTILLKTSAIAKIMIVALCTWIFARGIRLSLPSALVVTICFSLSTFNIIRAGGHFGLGMTWPVPLIGLAVFRAWEYSENKSVRFDRRLLLKSLPMALAMLLCGLSGFYWTIFGLLLFSGVALVILVKFLKPKRRLLKMFELQTIFKRLSALLMFAVPLATGFLLQIVPSAWTQRSDPPLVPAAARSWIEPIIYGGTASSFLFDVHAFVLRVIGRPDILAFLEGRSTWEARQLGAVAGLAFYVLVLAWGTKKLMSQVEPLPKSNSQSQITRTQFRLSAFVAISFLLYLVTPVNFVLSRTLLPFIRAWGRASVFLTLFLLALLLFQVDRIRQTVIRVVICAGLLLIQFTELNQYRETFPEGTALAATAREVAKLREATIADIGRILEPGCGIVQIPLYPFPEFDTPRDSNGDYGLLELPTTDRIGYRWSYGAMKNTSSFRFFAPLVTQQPPFGRADLATQIEYASALKPCGVVIDRSYLYKEELEALAASKTGVISRCSQKLDGEKFQDESRYFLIDFRANRCLPKVSQAVQESIDLVSSGHFQWQNVTGSVEHYYEDFPLIATPQQHVLMYSLRGESKSIALSLSFVLLSRGQPVPEQSFRFCMDNSTVGCGQARTDSKGQASVQVVLSEAAYFHSISNISINDVSESVDQWGVSFRSLSSED